MRRTDTRFKTLWLLFLAVGVLDGRAAAQDVCQLCQATIQRDIKRIDFDFKEALTFLDSMTESTFREVTNGGTVGLSLPFKVPIKAQGGWQSLDAFRKDVFRQVGRTSNTSQSKHDLEETMSSRGYDSFDRCIQACTQASNVLAVFLIPQYDTATETEIPILLRYEVPGGVQPSGRVTSSRLTNAASDAAVATGELISRDTPLPPDSTRIINVRRSSASVAVTGSINVDNVTSAAFKIPPIVVPRPVPTFDVSGQTRPNPKDSRGVDVVITGRIKANGVSLKGRKLWTVFTRPDGSRELNDWGFNESTGALVGNTRFSNIGNNGCLDDYSLILTEGSSQMGEVLAWVDLETVQLGRPAGCR